MAVSTKDQNSVEVLISVASFNYLLCMEDEFILENNKGLLEICQTVTPL